MSFLYDDLLVPAMHAADWIGMNGKGDVLMNAAVGPENARCIGIIALVRADAFDDAHHPLPFFDFVDRDLICRPTIIFGILLSTPSADVMRTGDDSRTHAFRNPGAVNEIPYLSRDADKIAGIYIPTFGVARM